MKNWTGERLETHVDLETTLEHLHRYAISLDFIKNKIVLDIASGEGYGSNLLSTVAAEVVGVDISKDAIAAASVKYKKGNLKFIEGSASAIPCNDSFFDVVISFETIEHHDKHGEMMLEIRRVLKPGGILVISSPDKFFYSDLKSHKNKFHVKELYKDEFKSLLKKHFTNVDFYFQRPTYASILIPENSSATSFKEYYGSFTEIKERTEFGQLYIVGVASDNLIQTLAASVFTDDEFLARQVYSNNLKVKATASYKLGHRLLSPVKLIARLVGLK